MARRRPLALSASALAVALALTGCSGGGTDSESVSTDAAGATPTPTTSQPVDCSTLTIDSDSSALPGVSADPGSAPSLTWSGELAPDNLTVKILSQGDGPEVEAYSFVTVNYAGWQWDSDATFDSSFDRGEPSSFSLRGVVDGWRCGLVGHRVGDRLLVGVPSDLAYGDDQSQGRPTGPLVFVVDVVAAPSTAGATMEGEADAASWGVSVSGDLGAPATVSVAEGATEPTETKVIVLARGTGDPITDQDVIGVNTAMTTWDDSASESTWDTGLPQTITMAQAPGLADLIGVPVGSRVVLLQAAGTATRRGSTAPAPAAAYVMDIETKL